MKRTDPIVTRAPQARENLDAATVEGFGFEWTQFDQRRVPVAELQRYFDQYFSIFPWSALPPSAAGFDLGCGSGRWAAFVAPRVGTLHCIDASAEAIAVAERALRGASNCRFHVAPAEAIPLPDASMDFGYSLGVLHHVPDTAGALRACAAKLKPGAPFLLYLYYALENRPWIHRLAWRASDLIRRLTVRLPLSGRRIITDLLATLVYWPLARTARTLSRLGLSVTWMPLSFYRESSFFTMRTDSFDRFATRLEKRFRSDEIVALLDAAGFDGTVVSPHPPYWCAVARRAGGPSR